jgi:hypothetical protein
MNEFKYKTKEDKVYIAIVIACNVAVGLAFYLTTV